MNKTNKFSPEVRERTVRLMQEHRREYPLIWAAVESIAPEIGCVPQTLVEWEMRDAVVAASARARSCVGPTRFSICLSPLHRVLGKADIDLSAGSRRDTRAKTINGL